MQEKQETREKKHEATNNEVCLLYLIQCTSFDMSISNLM
jgi:hypothetical protein